jgi:hypothetical protein
MAKLNKRVLSYGREKDHKQLRVLFMIHQGSTGKIACLDHETAAWYINEVDLIDLDGVSFKAWLNNEAGELRFARLSAAGLEDFTPEEVLELMTSYNPDIKGKASYVRTEKFDGGNVLTFGVDDHFAWSLSKLPSKWTVDLGVCRKKVRYQGKKDLVERLIEANLITRTEGVDIAEDEDITDKS